MAEIKKYNVFLNELQADKVNLLASVSGKEPEEVVNDAVYGYLAIADPFAVDKEPMDNQHEIQFYIPESVAKQMLYALKLEDYDSLDEYIKTQVVSCFGLK